MGADKWKYYDVEDYKSWKRSQGKEFRCPPKENYLAAAIYIRNLFEKKEWKWAAVGSLAMLCLGSHRPMSDIHIVYDDEDYKRIRAKLEADDRVRLPKGLNSLFPIKLLVKTGSQFKDPGVTIAADIEVDLVPAGSHGAPTKDGLRKSQVLLRTNGTDGKLISFKGVNLLYLLNVALHYANDQSLLWDPKQDIVFLCANYGKDIEPIRSQLPAKLRHDNFFSTPMFANLPIDAQRVCSMTLLGQELIKSSTPKMTVTPPPRSNTTGPAIPHGAHEMDARAAVQPRKSAPSLNKGTHPPTTQRRPSPPTAANASVPRSNSQPHMATGTRAQAVPVYSAGADTRSNYRPSSSSTHPSQANPSVATAPTQLANIRPMSIDSRGQGRSALQGPASQHVRSVSNPHMVPGVSTKAVQGVHVPRKTVPESNEVYTRGRAVAHGQHAPRQAAAAVPPVPSVPRGYAASAWTAPGANRARHSSQPPLQARAGKDMDPTGFNALIRAQKATQKEMLQDALPVGNAYSSYWAEHDRPYASSEEKQQAAGLRLVGPEGVYAAPKQTSSDIARTQVQASKGAPGHPHTFAAELPSASPTPKPRIDSPQELGQRSLPGSRRTSPLQHSHHPPAQHAFISELPADSAIPQQPLTAPLYSHHAELEVPTRPSQPLTSSEPFTGLPPSLLAGGLKRSPTSTPTPPSHSPQQHPQTYTNPYVQAQPVSSNYTAYTAYSGAGSPPATQTSLYTAYSAPSTAATAPSFPPAPTPASEVQYNTKPFQHQPEPARPHSQPQSQPQQTHCERVNPIHPINPSGNRNSNPTVEAEIAILQRMQPKRLVTGYEAFAHGPYTPIDSEKSDSARTPNSAADGYGSGLKLTQTRSRELSQTLSYEQGGEQIDVVRRTNTDMGIEGNRGDRATMYSVDSVYSQASLEEGYGSESEGSDGDGLQDVEVPMPLQFKRRTTELQ